MLRGIDANVKIGNDSSPISIYLTNATDWWKIWEYQVGIQIKIGKFSYTASSGIGEFNASIGWDDYSIDFQIGINKIGVGVSQSIDGIIHYNQYYIRTIPLAIVLVCIGTVIIAAPETIPVICLLFI